MDFLTQLSIRYTEKSAVLDEEDPEDQGWLYNQKFNKKIYFLNLHNAYNLLTGDNLVSMLLKPSYTTQESEKVRIVNQF